jgi:hypothetical protein
MNYTGLRDWLTKVDALGELSTLENIDWNLEMGQHEVFPRFDEFHGPAAFGGFQLFSGNLHEFVSFISKYHVFHT